MTWIVYRITVSAMKAKDSKMKMLLAITIAAVVIIEATIKVI